MFNGAERSQREPNTASLDATGREAFINEISVVVPDESPELPLSDAILEAVQFAVKMVRILDERVGPQSVGCVTVDLGDGIVRGDAERVGDWVRVSVRLFGYRPAEKLWLDGELDHFEDPVAVVTQSEAVRQLVTASVGSQL